MWKLRPTHLLCMLCWPPLGRPLTSTLLLLRHSIGSHCYRRDERRRVSGPGYGGDIVEEPMNVSTLRGHLSYAAVGTELSRPRFNVAHELTAFPRPCQGLQHMPSQHAALYAPRVPVSCVQIGRGGGSARAVASDAGQQQGGLRRGKTTQGIMVDAPMNHGDFYIHW